MEKHTTNNYLERIEELENRLAEAEDLIDAIKAGEVDAFALNKNDTHEVFTLQSGDFAYRVMVENINEGALNLSNDQLIVYTNKSFYELLGLPYESVIANSITTFIHPSSIQIFQRLFSEALQGESKGEINLKTGDKIIPVYISLTSLQPHLPTVGMVVTDLTEKKEVEKEREVKTMLHKIFKQSPAAIAIFEVPGFVFVSANHIYMKLVNRTEEELLGKSLAEVFPEAIKYGVIERYQKVYETGEAIELFEFESKWNRNRDGKIDGGYFNAVIQPIKDDKGNVVSIMNHTIEVTDQVLARRKIEQSENELNELANAVPQLVWMANADGRILYYNKRIYEFTPDAQDQQGVWVWEELLHPDDLPSTIEAWNSSIKNKVAYEKEHRIKLKDGSYRWFLSRGYPQISNEGALVKWYGTATDIHAQKMHEAQKDDFLKMVSHELKTPITSIKGYVQLLLAMLIDQQNAVAALVRQPLQRIDNQVERLGKLITDILDVSRLEDGRMDLQKDFFRLDELVKETVQDILFATTTHHIIINQTTACTIFADKNRIGQVLINLINNAIKYSRENTVIEINIFYPATGYIAVSIKDYGIGIDEAEQRKIFHRFYQVGDHYSMHYTGFGIGLYISAEIIRRHGGEIAVDSQKNRGSLFTFTLPVNNQVAST
ncbi:MAG: PAS domain S-box protein [Agriterribacter sp.]